MKPAKYIKRQDFYNNKDKKTKKKREMDKVKKHFIICTQEKRHKKSYFEAKRRKSKLVR